MVGRRETSPAGATALRLACAAVLDLHPEDLRPGSVRLKPVESSHAPFGSPCPLVVVQTLEGAVVQVFTRLLDDLGPLLAEPPTGGALLSTGNRARFIEALECRLPVREASRQVLCYTDREHFIPDRRHPVAALGPGGRPGRARPAGLDARAVQGGCGVIIKGQPVAYADYAPCGEHCASVAVYTDERFRGEGLGTSVVSAATRTLLDQGKIPIYIADAENVASQTICTGLGYVKFGEALYCFI